MEDEDEGPDVTAAGISSAAPKGDFERVVAGDEHFRSFSSFSFCSLSFRLVACSPDGKKVPGRKPADPTASVFTTLL